MVWCAWWEGYWHHRRDERRERSVASSSRHQLRGCAIFSGRSTHPNDWPTDRPTDRPTDAPWRADRRSTRRRTKNRQKAYTILTTGLAYVPAKSQIHLQANNLTSEIRTIIAKMQRRISSSRFTTSSTTAKKRTSKPCNRRRTVHTVRLTTYPTMNVVFADTHAVSRHLSNHSREHPHAHKHTHTHTRI